MRSKAVPVDKNGRKTPDWERWFAWHPVYVYASLTPGTLIRWRVWWEYCERKRTYHGGFDGTTCLKEYRLCEQKPGEDFQL